MWTLERLLAIGLRVFDVSHAASSLVVAAMHAVAFAASYVPRASVELATFARRIPAKPRTLAWRG